MKILKRRKHSFFSRRSNIVPLVLLGVIMIFAILPKGLLPRDPFDIDLSRRLKGPVFSSNYLSGYLLGTDSLGRDVFSRLIYGTRYSMILAFVSASIALIVGTCFGLVSGYYGKLLDTIFMRIVDVQMAFPATLLSIAVVAVIGPSFTNLVIVLSLSSWAKYARLVRGSVLAIRSSEYILSARAIGLRDFRILYKYILPNVLSPIIVMSTFEVARILITESALSFLGLGILPPTPSWGNMIADGKNYLYAAPWVSAIPGLAISLAVLSFNLLGDGLRDHLDPRMKHLINT